MILLFYVLVLALNGLPGGQTRCPGFPPKSVFRCPICLFFFLFFVFFCVFGHVSGSSCVYDILILNQIVLFLSRWFSLFLLRKKGYILGILRDILSVGLYGIWYHILNSSIDTSRIPQCNGFEVVFSSRM